MPTRLVTGLGLSFCPGVCYSYQDLKFYAENGCICLHDEEDGSFIVLQCREFLDRAGALNEDAKRLARLSIEQPSRAKIHAEERHTLQNVVADMISCVQEARDQGDHFEPAVMEWFRRHRPWSRGRVSMSGAANFQTPAPGPLPRGRHTGRTAAAGQTPGQYAALNAQDRAAARRTASRSSSVKKLILPNSML